MIASLGGYAFHAFATGLGGVVQGTAQASAGDVARGSFNAGQVNYRNVSAGTTSLGSFVWGTTSVLTSSMNQHQMDNITRQGDIVTLNKGSVGQAKAFMSQLDETSQRIVANAFAIAGEKGLVSMVYNEKTKQLQSLSIVGGEGGFAVHYDGSGKFVVEKGGVKHGSVELDDSGEITGFKSFSSVGSLNMEAVRTKAEQIRETAGIYQALGQAFREIASGSVSATTLKSLRENLSKLLEKDFSSFMEAARTWGLDVDMVKEVLRSVGLTRQDDFRVGNATQLSIGGGIRGGIGVGKNPEEKGGGFSLKLLRLGANAYLDIGANRIYRDEDIKSMTARMSKEQKDAMIEKFVNSLMNKEGERSGSREAKVNNETVSEGKDVAQESRMGKAYELAESFDKKAAQELSRAEILQASLKQDPLNFYAQKKYEEALKAGKSPGESVRYAMEEVAKLKDDPKALEEWLTKFAEEQGIQGPNVNKDELQGVIKGVPSQESINQRGEELRRDVNNVIKDSTNVINEKEAQLRLFNPRNAELFKIQPFMIKLDFDPKDPTFQAYRNQALGWYKAQDNPFKRFGQDLNNIVEKFERWVKENFKRLNIPPKNNEPYESPFTTSDGNMRSP